MGYDLFGTKFGNFGQPLQDKSRSYFVGPKPCRLFLFSLKVVGLSAFPMQPPRPLMIQAALASLTRSPEILLRENMPTQNTQGNSSRSLLIPPFAGLALILMVRTYDNIEQVKEVGKRVTDSQQALAA